MSSVVQRSPLRVHMNLASKKSGRFAYEGLLYSQSNRVISNQKSLASHSIVGVTNSHVELSIMQIRFYAIFVEVLIHLI
jgi:hypothetical protein